MRKLISLLLLIPAQLMAQSNNGYAFIQPSLFIKNNYDNRFHLNAGVGFRMGDYLGLGVSLDGYAFKKGYDAFVIPKADFRAFLHKRDKEVSPFLSFQPGYVIYEKNVAGRKITGAFAFDALTGVLAKGKNGFPGITMAMGFSTFGFSGYGNIRYNAFKIQAGIAL